jgi:uncharacterized protein YbjT (DUF2867 family)
VREEDTVAISRVAVIGASGRQGLAQIRQLRRQEYEVRGLTRRKPVADGPEFEDVRWIPADLDDAASLDEAFEGMDAVFFTPPAFAGSAHRLDQARHVGEAANRAGLERVVYNTSVYIPQALGSEPPYDYVLEGILALESTGAPVVTFGPVLFMDNLLDPLANWAERQDWTLQADRPPGG